MRVMIRSLMTIYEMRTSSSNHPISLHTTARLWAIKQLSFGEDDSGLSPGGRGLFIFIDCYALSSLQSFTHHSDMICYLQLPFLSHRRNTVTITTWVPHTPDARSTKLDTRNSPLLINE